MAEFISISVVAGQRCSAIDMAAAFAYLAVTSLAYLAATWPYLAVASLVTAAAAEGKLPSTSTSSSPCWELQFIMLRSHRH